MKLLAFLCIFCILGVLFNDIKAIEDTEKPKTELPKIGNLSLRGSQRPGRLAAKLQNNILGKSQVQFYLYADLFTGNKRYNTDLIPLMIYGMTDNVSFTVNIPYAPKNKYSLNKSSGLEDLVVQIQYAFYTNQKECSVDQFVINYSVNLPTGSCTKTPITGYGSASGLIGLIYNHTGVEWIYLGSTGVLLTQKHDGFRQGNQYFYEGGFGKNIWSPPGWIYAWILEIVGRYSWKNTVNNQIDPNSGGNVIFVAPSLWISSDKLIIQFGVGYPVVQHLFGSQLKQRLAYELGFAWTF